MFVSHARGGFFPPDRVLVEPAQQRAQRPQRAVEHQHVDRQDRQQQEEIEPDDPPEDRLTQLVLLEGRRHHRQFEPAAVAVAEDRAQHARRLLVILLGDVDLLVRVTLVREPGGILPRDLLQEVALVARGRRDHLAAGELLRDDRLGTVLEGIVRLVVDLVDERDVEKEGPRRQQQRQHPRNMEDDPVDEFHGWTSL